MLTRQQTEAIYARQVLGVEDQTKRLALMAELAKVDLYFLLTVVLKREDARNDWAYARCREFESAPDGHLDLWYRGSWKTSIITLAGTIQEIIRDPEITVGIFSFNRPAAKAPLRQIKREMEQNPLLPLLWPHIFWKKPGSEAPTWSADSGLIVKRRTNPKEATCEAWGLVEGQPVGRHFKLMVYDDVVMQGSVTGPEMIAKTIEGWELSLNLIAEGGRRRYIGTRYHYQDAYAAMIDRQAAKLREHPADDEDGQPAGHLSAEQLAEKRREMGIRTYNSQMRLRPTADSTVGFLEEWLRWHDGIEPPGDGMNRYIVVDPANSKRKESDWTSMWVIGAGSDNNYHVCEVIRDRMSLRERVATVMHLHRKWRPINVGYERYGLQADIDAIRVEQNRVNYRFGVTELAGKLAKPDRIERLMPVFQAYRIWMPRSQHRTLYDGKTVDLIAHFINFEYLPYPAVRYDDMLDALSRIMDADLGVIFPEPDLEEGLDSYELAARRRGQEGGRSWMAA